MLQAQQVLKGRYQLQEKLGQNAGRQTWLATDLETTHPALIKLLAFDSEVQWDEIKLFEREAQVLKHLNHPQIPKYQDYFCVDDRLLWFGLVQEYIPGSSLKELLTQGKKFTLAQVRQIAVDVLNILIYLHGLSPPVLHRDIKPSNLIWGEDEQVYLVDFGAVQDRAAKEGATFTVVGTYGYAPMEQFGGRAVPASDLYALGATLIHLLTGTAPADLPQRKLRIQFSDISLNPSFARWLQCLIEPAVEQRFSSARSALAALETGHFQSKGIAVTRPTGSRVQLKKSASELEIKIPGRGIQMKEALLMVGCLYGFLLVISFLSASAGSSDFLIYLIAVLVSLSIRLSLAFVQVYLHFDSNYFEIEWKLWGWRYWQERGKVLDIHKVGETEAPIGEHRGVIIQFGVRKCIFGASDPPLVEVERRWLVQEIRDWLGLSSV